MLLNCGIGEDSWESLRLQGDPTSQSKRKSVLNIHWKTDGEAPILWPPDVKSWLIGKDPDAWKDWRWEEKGMTEDEMVGWHYQPDGHEFEQAPGFSDGQKGLACCSPWGLKELDTTKWLNWSSSIHGLLQARILELVALESFILIGKIISDCVKRYKEIIIGNRLEREQSEDR